MRTQVKVLVSTLKKAAVGGYGIKKGVDLEKLQQEITRIIGITTDRSPVTSIAFTRDKETNVSPVEHTFCIH